MAAACKRLWARAFWRQRQRAVAAGNAKAGRDILNQAAEQAAGEDFHLRCTVFEGDTVVPENEPADARASHMSVWPAVYGIEALRDWLFTRKKED